MTPKKKPKPRLCEYCGELAVYFPSEAEMLLPIKLRKSTKPIIHDSCKPFYILLKKLSPQSK